MRFIKDIHKRFTRLNQNQRIIILATAFLIVLTRLNQNQRIIILATAFLIVLNCIILILSIDIISRALEKFG